MAHVFTQTLRFQLHIAFVAQCATAAFNKTQIGELNGAVFAAETPRMPIRIHRLDHASDHKFAAFSATRREQHLEIVLAILATLEFEKRTIFENLKALRATVILKPFKIFHL